MKSLRRTLCLLAVILSSVASVAYAQDSGDRGELLIVRPADESAEEHISGDLEGPAPLTEVAPAPTAREALPPRPVIVNSGQMFEKGYYRGVVPGKNNLPPRARRLKRTRKNFVTWPGFEINNTGSRIFIQSTRPVTYSRSNEAGRIVLVLKNTRIHLRNNRNPLVTEHFNTPVAEAYLRARRRDTLLILEMKVDANPRIRQISENGYHFIFLEFQGGNYPIPTEIRRGYIHSKTQKTRRRRR